MGIVALHSSLKQEQEQERRLSIFPSPEVTAVPEFIDLVFAKTSPKRSFCMTENERIGLVFPKAGSLNSGTGVFRELQLIPVLVPAHLCTGSCGAALGVSPSSSEGLY
jgi:hypothetical protein